MTERAVSPVIGVILMVAVTVILAAIVGTFVFDFGQQTTDRVPQVTMDYSYDNGTLTVRHTGGDTIDGERLSVVVNGTSHAWADENITAGDILVVSAAQGDLVEVVWRGDDGTAIISEYRVP